MRATNQEFREHEEWHRNEASGFSLCFCNPVWMLEKLTVWKDDGTPT